MQVRTSVLLLLALLGAVAVPERTVRAGGPGRDANFFLRGFGSSFEDDRAIDVAVTDDSVYICGLTNGDDYPISASAFDRRRGGDYDAFVMRVGRDGRLIWSTYLGSPGMDSATGIDVDDEGNVYVVGTTSNAAFPTTPGALRTQFAGSSEGFAAKLSPDGTTLLYATFVGGNDTDNAARVRCGPDGT